MASFARPEFETANGTGVCAEDLPACCRREADEAGEWDFECRACGAMWFRAAGVPDVPAMTTPAMTKKNGRTEKLRPFLPTERAGSDTVSDCTPALMLGDPALQADRPIACHCGHETVGEHNRDASALLKRLGRP